MKEKERSCLLMLEKFIDIRLFYETNKCFFLPFVNWFTSDGQVSDDQIEEIVFFRFFCSSWTWQTIDNCHCRVSSSLFFRRRRKKKCLSSECWLSWYIYTNRIIISLSPNQQPSDITSRFPRRISEYFIKTYSIASTHYVTFSSEN